MTGPSVIQQQYIISSSDGIYDWFAQGFQPKFQFFQDVLIKENTDPAIPHLDIYLKETKTLTWKDIYTLMSTAALFIVAKI